MSVELKRDDQEGDAVSRLKSRLKHLKAKARTKGNYTVYIGAMTGNEWRMSLNPTLPPLIQLSHGRLLREAAAVARGGVRVYHAQVDTFLNSSISISHNVRRSSMAPRPKMELVPTKGW